MSAASGGGDLPYGMAPDGHRLPATTRLGPVRLQVADLERSLGYYRRILGLRPLAGRDAARVLGPPGGRTPLVELRERPGAAPMPRGGRPGLYHYAILLPDRAALGRFAAHLAERGERPGAADHAVSEALYLRDPDGLGIEVYADRPHSAWRHRGGQLVMTTDPLDLPDLLRAGAGARWTGMPEGSAIGHVHLHVGDLARAESFYHRALGLDKVVWSYPGALFLSAGGYHHHLGLNTWASEKAPDGEDEARLLEWEIRVDTAGEARAALDSVAAAGHPVERGPEGGLVRDPWGTALRLRAAEGEPSRPRG